VDKALARDRTARFGSAGQMLEALRALAPADPALRLLAPSTPVVLAGAPSNPSLAFADTLPQSSGASRGTPPALIRAARIAPGGYPLAEKRSRTPRPRVAPKPRFFAWSWVAAFVAALGGVMTTAWVATSLSGRAPAGAQAPSSQADSVPLPRLAESSTRTAPPALDAGSSGVTGEPARGVKAGEDH
jgi:hypothetical protein